LLNTIKGIIQFIVSLSHQPFGLQDFRVLYHLISGVCVKFSKSCGVLEISIDWTDAKFQTGKFRHNKAVYKREKNKSRFLPKTVAKKFQAFAITASGFFVL
jgi:hypothetical protein